MESYPTIQPREEEDLSVCWGAETCKHPGWIWDPQSTTLQDQPMEFISPLCHAHLSVDTRDQVERCDVATECHSIVRPVVGPRQLGCGNGHGDDCRAFSVNDTGTPGLRCRCTHSPGTAPQEEKVQLV